MDTLRVARNKNVNCNFFSFFPLYSFFVYVKIPFSSPKSRKRRKVERNGIKNWFHFGESTGAEKIPHEKSASKPRVA